MKKEELKDTLEFLYDKYNNPSFIELDPISIPHQFSDKMDIEIAGFMASVIAWGNRKMIVRSANKMMELMDGRPYWFVMNHREEDLIPLTDFVHRTFNGIDFQCFVKSLRNIYINYGSLGDFFQNNYQQCSDIRVVLSRFREVFFEGIDSPRSHKHLSSIDKNSACKKMCMLLRWFVRNDNRGVDFGIWDKIPTKALYLPLDLHSGNVGREFGLLTRKQNDWKAVEEITEELRKFDINDPVKYDYALFGLGVNR